MTLARDLDAPSVVLEVDEAILDLAVRQTRPRVIMLLNLSREYTRGVLMRQIARDELGKLRVQENVLETLDRTLNHLCENKVDLDQTKLTLGSLLQVEPGREAFVNHPEANSMLTREYRKPFVVPSESEVG